MCLSSDNFSPAVVSTLFKKKKKIFHIISELPVDVGIPGECDPPLLL